MNAHVVNAAKIDGSIGAGAPVHPFTVTLTLGWGIQGYFRPKWLIDRQPARYAGRYQIGGRVSIIAKCVPGGKPIQPASAGVMRVYGGSLITRNLQLPVGAGDQNSVGLFRGEFVPDNTDAPGRYFALVAFVANGLPSAEVLSFELVPGGHALGAILAVFSTQRPDTAVVLAHTEAGKITTGRGVYLDEGI